MKKIVQAIVILVLVFVFASCSSFAPQPTATQLPTQTPLPTSTPVPVSTASGPAPRWMILGLPGQHIEIMDETWVYRDYRWGETYACIDYTRETAPYMFFEQCFALAQPDLTFESQRDAVLNDDYETLTPNNTFGNVGQISLMAKRLENDSFKGIKFFEIIGIEKYVLLVEMNMETDDASPLQTVYEEHAAGTLDYILQSMLEKSRFIPTPAATALSPTQEGFQAALSENLITETEASTLYGSPWEAIGDFVDPENPMVCRDFEGRTNEDVLWVRFSNCAFLHHPDFSFDGFARGYEKPENTFLQSRNQYDDQYFIYYKFPKIYAWMVHGDYLYNVVLESRTIFGEQNIEDNFTTEIDDFIHGVLKINAEK